MPELYGRWILAEAQVEEFKKAEAFLQNENAKELRITELGKALKES
jgi:hypothetical protein